VRRTAELDAPALGLGGSSTMSASIQPFPLVRRGDEGHPVTTLQYLLRAHGHQIAADGIFGPRTEAAVKAVQQANGLAADGIVGPLTWPKVIVTVRQGSQGDAVRGVQEEFQFRNLSGDPSKGVQVDGIFGPQTDAAVRGFQDALGITVDGIVGPVTWRALVSGMLSG
jgi:peptidoglycan hydrolase-like protein with peptidoglycan-binding domain